MKIMKRISFLAMAVAGLLAAACSSVEEENGFLGLTRCLEPLGLSADIKGGDKVIFGWKVTKDAAQYNLEVFSDEAMTKPVLSKTLDASDVPFTVQLDADEVYWWRVQATNSAAGLQDSKWAVAKSSVKTYAERDNLFLEITEKTSTSISVAWSKEVSDYKDVDHIEYGPLTGDAEKVTYTLTPEDIEAACATISDLTPSTQYVVTLYYSSAPRGEVNAYTAADTQGFTIVKSMDELRNALKTPGVKIQLLKEGSPYQMEEGETLDIVGDMTMVGEEGADGSKPVIKGEFNAIATTTGSIIFENVELNGYGKRGFTFQLKEGAKISDPVAISELKFRNCVITEYTKGLIYEWGQPFNISKLIWDGCIIDKINETGLGGGDVIDIRGTASAPLSTFGEIQLVNNTISNGGRAFLRIDFPQSLGSIKFDGNTLYNLCVSTNSNNSGIISLQTAPTEMSFKNNLILSMCKYSRLGNGTTTVSSGGFDGFKYWNGVSYDNNWYYDVVYDPDRTETSSDTDHNFFNARFPLSSATALTADPCFNAAGGMFNLTNSKLVEAKVGDPRWWTAYVEAPEDLTLGTVEGSHTWDFSDAKLFSGTISKEMVRDLLYINASGDNAISVNDGVMNFTASTVTSKKGVPVEGYFAFKVTGPGSVIVKAEDPSGANSHVIVGTGPLDGSTVTVKGGAAAIAESSTPVKIPITTITEECYVYVWVSGPAGISKLAWTTDVSPVNTSLPAPAPKAEPGSVTAGESTDIVISWEAVENAGGYSVMFNGKTYAVEEGELSYTLSGTTIGMLDPGSYTVQVFANPGESDIYNTESAAGTAAFAILPKADEGGDTGTVVRNVDQLNAALAASKEEIILAGDGTFDFSEAETKSLTPMASVKLVGQDGATVTGANFSLTSASAEVAVENIKFVAGGQSNFIEFSADGATMTSLKVTGTTIDGYSKSVIYGNSDANNIGEVVFKGITVTNHGTGQGMFDFRKGEYSTIQITESTISGGRDFIRVDGGVVNGVIDISKNTLYTLNPANNGNGVLYVRSTSNSTYTVTDNLFHTMTALLAKKDGVKVPSMSNNFYFGMGENVFTGIITQEIATSGDGVVMTADPGKNAASGDFTLTSGLAMSSKVGDPRWNPSYDGGASDSFLVKSVEEFDAAIAAGKKELTFALSGSPYNLSASPAIIVPDIRLSGEAGGKPSLILPQIDLEGDMGSIIIENLDIIGNGGNLLNVKTAGTIDKVIIRSSSIKGLSKSLWYDNVGATVSALTISDVNFSELGAGQGTIDIRKGSYTSVTIENSTVTGGRDLIRADGGTITGSTAINNNTIVDACTGNSNGILYVRATPESYVVKNNLIMFSSTATKTLGKSGVTVPKMSANFFYNVTDDYFKHLDTDGVTYVGGGISKEEALAGGGVVLGSSPVKDITGGNYTLTDALALGSNVGDPDWNPNAGQVTTDITVSTAEEFLNAVSAGKTAVTLKYGTYDFRTADNSTGDIVLEAGITIVGQTRGGKGPEILGNLQLKTGISTLVLQNLYFNGSNTIGNAINLASAVSAEKVLISGCEFSGYTKSVFYASQDGTALGTVTFDKNLVHDMGTGQGMLDIRKGTIGTLIVSNSTFYNGGRDFLRCDAGIAGSVAIKNNTFAGCSVDAGNGLLWVRSCADTPSKYTVSKNLFVNIGGSSKLAKTGATVPVMDNNFFFNVGESFFKEGTSAISQEVATGNGGAVLTADPCTDSAAYSLKVTDAAVKAAGAGDPRWL